MENKLCCLINPFIWCVECGWRACESCQQILPFFNSEHRDASPECEKPWFTYDKPNVPTC